MFEGIKELREYNATAMEAIDFQPKKEFGLAIEAELERIISSGRVTKKVISESNLGSIIEHFTGMPIKMVGESGYDAYMMFDNAMNKNHPLIDGFIRNFLVDDVRKTMVEYGKMKHRFIRVDLRNGYIHNLNPDVKHVIGLGTKFFSGDTKINLKETTAFLLHEIGHWFAYYEFLVRSLSTNAILLDVSQRILNIDDPEKRILAVSELRKEGIDNKALDEIEKVASAKEAAVLILTEDIKQAKSEFGIDVYDVAQWEKLADQYAARWGYGRYVVSAIDKLYQEYGMATRASAISELVMSTRLAIGFAFTVFGSLGSGVALLAMGNVGGLLFIFFAVLVLGFIGLMGDPAWEYDDNKIRFNNLKKQLIARLKETDDTKEIRQLLNDIKEMETIIDRTFNDDDYNAIKVLCRRLGVVSGRRRWRALEAQRIMEYFANSELHLGAARLENV